VEVCAVRSLCICALLGLLAVWAAPPAQADSIFLIIPNDGSFDTFANEPNGEVVYDEVVYEPYESYTVIHYATVTGGVYPFSLDVTVATGINPMLGSLVGSEYMYLGVVSPAVTGDPINHLLVSAGPGAGDTLLTSFAVQTANGVDALAGFGEGDLDMLGDVTTMSADTFWNVFVGANPEAFPFYSAEEFADFVNAGAAGLVPFNVISVIEPTGEGELDGMGIDNLLGFTELVAFIDPPILPSLAGTLSVFTNAQGVVNDPTGPQGTFVPTVPEPALALLLLCGAGFVVRRRRRR
jgi:hypothetical protein